MNKVVRSTVLSAVIVAAIWSGGCEAPPPPYGTEKQLFLPGAKRQVWAVAPVVNLSGEKGVDAILQADLVFEQMQQVHGLTMVPVNRVVEVFAGLHIEKVQSPEQAAIVCDLLGCDALVVPTVTVYDPYDPPKLGASLQVFAKPAGFTRAKNVDVHELSRAAGPQDDNQSLPGPSTHFLQAVGIYDATNGSVRDAVQEYAHGPQDPVGPMGAREYLVSMDRYCSFVYFTLTVDVLRQMDPKTPATNETEPKMAGGKVKSRKKDSGSAGM